ncbi:hypothetical protein D3C72_1260000 [compost metagenome]
MHVRIPQARHQIFAGQADGPLWRVAAQLRVIDDGDDAVALEQHGFALDRLAAGNVDHGGVAQGDVDGDLVGRVGMGEQAQRQHGAGYVFHVRHSYSTST